MILAAIATSGELSNPWITMVAGSIVGGIVCWVIKTVLPSKPSPIVTQSPVEVREAVRYARWEELGDLRREFLTFRDQISKDVKEVENKVDGVGQMVERQKDAIMGKLSKDIHDVHSRLDVVAQEMPQRIITLLNTTGALKRHE